MLHPPSRHALAHEHARARRGLKHIVDALDLERGALFVRTCADGLRDLLGLCAGDERGRIGAALWWPEVRLAADKDDGYLWATDRANFFYPLLIMISAEVIAAGEGRTHLDRDVVE